LALVTGM